MSKVAIVTDSTAFIPNDKMVGHNITIVPLQVIWGENIYLDGIDIQPNEFYQRLKNSRVMPSTSQATPAAFEMAYRNLIDAGYDILSIHISGNLSGTLDSAVQAKSAFPGAKIELFDSEGASMILGFQILAIAHAIEQGAGLKECLQVAEKARQASNAIFVVKTLEYLHRGGRIGGAAAFFGTALNLKPLLSLREGKIEAIDRVRTLNKAIDRMLDLLEERIDGRTPIHLSVLHADAKEDALHLQKIIQERFKDYDLQDSFISEISPVIGTHTGPGTLGIAYLVGM